MWNIIIVVVVFCHGAETKKTRPFLMKFSDEMYKKPFDVFRRFSSSLSLSFTHSTSSSDNFVMFHEFLRKSTERNKKFFFWEKKIIYKTWNKMRVEMKWGIFWEDGWSGVRKGLFLTFNNFSEIIYIKNIPIKKTQTLSGKSKVM